MTGSRARIEAEARAAARSAGLRYVTDDTPGITREMGTLGYRFRAPGGRRIKDARELKRILALAVPPAWTDVWICPDPRGHLQATGRDARGRKQHRYHPNWRSHRDGTKFERMRDFAAALPRIHRRTAADLARPGLPRQKVLAAVVQLLEKSLIRVGNDEYAKQNDSFGLTTLRNTHVAVTGEKVDFKFKGKSGVKHAVHVQDGRLAKVVKKCRDLPGIELFQYVDETGRVRDVKAADVNGYIREISGRDFSAKDFRTWAGTVLCCRALVGFGKAETKAQAKRNSLQAIDAVAGVLGNTRSVCRRSYIHPAVIDAYLDGSMRALLQMQERLTVAPRRKRAA
jgi:DNA topoisomerase I